MVRSMKKPVLCENKEDCCGCTACAAVCPKHAITFQYDLEGFLYPQVDLNKCIGCLRCEKVCAFKKDIKAPIKEYEKTRVFAAKSKSKAVIASSSSGGMFTVFSDAFLDKNDIVAACQYSYETDSVVFSIIKDKETRDKAKGSKYIQAELNDSFDNLVEILRKNKDKSALVFGTGCQIAGLDLLLKNLNLRSQVVLVDLICHGAASSNLWKNFIQKIESEQDNTISYVTFKDKRNGWGSPSTFALINDKEVSIKPYADWFYMGLSLRKSCYKCPYTRIDRHSDITIGDYWGIKKVMPEFYDRMGISLVITHSDVGNAFFDSVKDNLDYRISNRTECLQPRLVSPQLYPAMRETFWRDMQNHGIDYCERKYRECHTESKKERIKNYIKKVINRLT